MPKVSRKKGGRGRSGARPRASQTSSSTCFPFPLLSPTMLLLQAHSPVLPPYSSSHQPCPLLASPGLEYRVEDRNDPAVSPTSSWRPGGSSRYLISLSEGQCSSPRGNFGTDPWLPVEPISGLQLVLWGACLLPSQALPQCPLLPQSM